MPAGKVIDETGEPKGDTIAHRAATAAALCITFNHLLLSIAPAAVFPWTAGGLAACGILGMNLFFVLSGFIIHYNYSGSLERFSWGNLYAFISARIARLYPLLVLFIAFEFFTEEYIWRTTPAIANAHLRALPAFLTFSQTWGYHRLDDQLSLAYAFKNASITWSISTEFLMYLLYPALLHLLLRSSDGWRVRLAKFLVALACLAMLVRWFHNHSDLVDLWGREHFGPAAGNDYNGTHSFTLWWLFLSPYMRIMEFSIGAAAAHLYLGLEGQPTNRTEKIAVGTAVLIALATIGASLMPPQLRWNGETLYHRYFGYLPAVAVIIFGCARLESGLMARVLSWRPLVWAGEASYSIYLIHIVFYNRFQTDPTSALAAVIRAVATIGIIILVARILFEYVENPARIWMRAQLRRLVGA